MAANGGISGMVRALIWEQGVLWGEAELNSYLLGNTLRRVRDLWRALGAGGEAAFGSVSKALCQGRRTQESQLLSALGRAVRGVASATCHSPSLPAPACLLQPVSGVRRQKWSLVFVLSAFDGSSVFHPPKPGEGGPRCPFLPPGRWSPSLSCMGGPEQRVPCPIPHLLCAP